MDDLYSLTQDKNFLSKDAGCSKKAGMIVYFVSLFLHLAFLTGIFFMQDITPPMVLPPAISVDLVSFSSVAEDDFMKSASEVKDSDALLAEPESEKKELLPEHEAEPVQIETVPEIKVKPKIKPEIKPEHMVKPAPAFKKKPVLKKKPGDLDKLKIVKQKKKSSLKRKTYSSEKVLANARKNIEKSLAVKNKDTLTSAFDRLRSKVSKNSSKKGSTNTLALVGAAANSSTKGRKAAAIDLYNLELMYRIQQNWVFNERVAKAENNIEVRILIKILKNGDIRDIWFETRSGNRYLDDSAFKAVKKSSPLSALPKGYSSYDVGLIFTPLGLK